VPLASARRSCHETENARELESLEPRPEQEPAERWACERGDSTGRLRSADRRRRRRSDGADRQVDG
jgi:hypothetical protein